MNFRLDTAGMTGVLLWVISYSLPAIAAPSDAIGTSTMQTPIIFMSTLKAPVSIPFDPKSKRASTTMEVATPDNCAFTVSVGPEPGLQPPMPGGSIGLTGSLTHGNCKGHEYVRGSVSAGGQYKDGAITVYPAVRVLAYP